MFKRISKEEKEAKRLNSFIDKWFEEHISIDETGKKIYFINVDNPEMVNWSEKRYPDFEIIQLKTGSSDYRSYIENMIIYRAML